MHALVDARHMHHEIRVVSGDRRERRTHREETGGIRQHRDRRAAVRHSASATALADHETHDGLTGTCARLHGNHSLIMLRLAKCTKARRAAFVREDRTAVLERQHLHHEKTECEHVLVEVRQVLHVRDQRGVCAKIHVRVLWLHSWDRATWLVGLAHHTAHVVHRRCVRLDGRYIQALFVLIGARRLGRRFNELDLTLRRLGDRRLHEGASHRVESRTNKGATRKQGGRVQRRRFRSGHTLGRRLSAATGHDSARPGEHVIFPLLM